MSRPLVLFLLGLLLIGLVPQPANAYVFFAEDPSTAPPPKASARLDHDPHRNQDIAPARPGPGPLEPSGPVRP
ncbi:MAG: hypothetical protein GF346_13450, partial [Candidatus Eisenbacteria bacterium]|nr:hypothetical protein [Candidatus Latescibacterota bacterium]MBD3303446.1 hypothetical protein [Candidatus Eisenbacteria bacterium]